ncbi:helix-turn-helix domain-containing protein [Streptomyces sp. O3]
MATTYGEWLAERRKEKGWTQQQLADKAFLTRSLIAAIEQGQRYPSERDAKQLDKALDISGDVLTTFRPGQATGDRRQATGNVPDWFETGREFEQKAVVIRKFGLSFVPGILQTKRYADAVLRRAYPPTSEDQRHKDVVTRLERAAILDDPVTPVVWALLDEGVLRRPFGAGVPLLAGMVSLMWFEDQPHGPALLVTPAAWSSLVSAIQSGTLNT